MSAADDGSKDRIAEFTDFRKRMNERILGEPNQVVRRFFALDTQTYQAGALDVKTKELLGLVASMVLRCDDCISYHVAQCKDAGVTREEFFETYSVGLVVGGSIVIPHLRRAVDFLDQLEGGAAAPAAHEHYQALRGLPRDPTAQEPLLVEGARRQAGVEEKCAGNSALPGSDQLPIWGLRAG